MKREKSSIKRTALSLVALCLAAGFTLPATAQEAIENGFFIPNESKKYSVGENAGMKLYAEGGIEIYVAARQPDGVPPENWLPINRGDYSIDLLMRLYAPNLERFKTWSPPKAETIK